MATKRAERTRNGGKWTESMLMSRIRSALRRIWQFYAPRIEAKNRRRRAVKKGNQKWEYQCEECKGWFKSKEVEVNHKIPAGSLKSFADLPMFCERLFCEDVDGYELNCKGCHSVKTQKDRNGRK